MITCFNRCKRLFFPLHFPSVQYIGTYGTSGHLIFFLYAENVCKNVFCKITLFKPTKNVFGTFSQKFSFLKFSEKRREIYGKVPELHTIHAVCCTERVRTLQKMVFNFSFVLVFIILRKYFSRPLLCNHYRQKHEE